MYMYTVLYISHYLHCTLYHSKLLQEGLTQTDIKYRVKAIETESESIYGTLYGTLDDDNE